MHNLNICGACGLNHYEEKLAAAAFHAPIKCGACAESIFTGATNHQHTCGRPTPRLTIETFDASGKKLSSITA